MRERPRCLAGFSSQGSLGGAGCTAASYPQDSHRFLSLQASVGLRYVR